MKKVVLLPNPHKDAEFSVSRRIAEVLRSVGIVVCIDRAFGTDLFGLAEVFSVLPADAQLLLVVGGDGSVLDASVFAIEHDLPLLGVNLGKLGYLSEVETGEIEKLARLADDAFCTEEKMLLCTERIVNGRSVDRSERLALNDVVISHETYLGITDLRLSGGSGSVHYRADGMILSTPAGSTAYSLSAGGPIVSHSVDAVLATPVCPHSFFNRSILFSPQEQIDVQNAGQDTLRVSVDGRHFSDLLPGEICRVTVSGRKVRFLTFRDNNMFSVLFRKMKTMEEIQ